MCNKLDLEINSKKKYNLFIERVINNNLVWGLKLKHIDGWAVSPSNYYEDTDVMVFWSDKSYAQICAREEWSDYEPTPINLELFLNKWIVGLNEDNMLLGINWNSNLIGLEVEPFDLLNDIIEALENITG